MLGEWISELKQQALINVNNCFNTETSGGQISNQNLYLLFSTPMLIRYLGRLKTLVFLHWRLICAILSTFSQHKNLTKF
jgi:hypothetical protein